MKMFFAISRGLFSRNPISQTHKNIIVNKSVNLPRSYCSWSWTNEGFFDKLLGMTGVIIIGTYSLCSGYEFAFTEAERDENDIFRKKIVKQRLMEMGGRQFEGIEPDLLSVYEDIDYPHKFTPKRVMKFLIGCTFPTLILLTLPVTIPGLILYAYFSEKQSLKDKK